MELTFNTHGNEKQKAACKAWLNPVISEIVYGGSKGSAKSYTGCSLIFGDAFIYPGTHYFIARKKLNDLRKYTIPSIFEVFQHWGLNENYYKYNGKDNYFTLYNDSKVYLLDAKYMPSDPLYTRFGSIQMSRGWIEEAGEFEEAAKNNLNASVGRWKNDIYNLPPKLLQTCNPSKNYLYKIYKDYKEKRLEKHIEFIQALPTDNKKLAAGYLEHLERTLSASEKERLLFGNWEYDDDPATLIEYENILNAFENSFVNPGKKYLTCDVARYGSDLIVIILWSGLRVERIIHKSKQSTDETAKQIKALAKEHKIPVSRIIIDSDGVGGGVSDQIKGSYNFINNSRPLKNENYTNLKSQCYYKLSELINDNQIYINAETLTLKIKERIILELEYIKQAKLDTDGKRSVMAKDAIKKLLGFSPDFADALMMRMVKEIDNKGNRLKGWI